MICQCPASCKNGAHEYQDQKYGKGNRLFNEVRVKGDLIGGRCTVCAPPKVKNAKRPYISISDLKVLSK